MKNDEAEEELKKRWHGKLLLYKCVMMIRYHFYGWFGFKDCTDD